MLRQLRHVEHRLAADRCRRKHQRRCVDRDMLARPQPVIACRDEAPDAVRHEADDEDHRQAVDRQVQTRNAFQKTQPFRNQNQQSRANCRPDRRCDAAEQRHCQEYNGFSEGELIRADISKTTGEQTAAKPAQHGAKRKRIDLGAEHIDSGNACREFVVAHGPHRATQPRIRQMPDDVADDPQHRDAEGQIRLRRLKQARPPDA